MKKILLLSISIIIAIFYLTKVNASYDLLNDINIYRAKSNLKPLQNDSKLCDLAKLRVEEIKNDWSHKQFQSEIDKIGGMDGVFHENLARTFEAKDVVWAWSMSKAGHKEAMLIPEMTLGCVAKSGEYYTFEGYTPKN